MALLVNLTLGTKNPTPATVEEISICFLSTFFLPLSVII